MASVAAPGFGNERCTTRADACCPRVDPNSRNGSPQLTALVARRYGRVLVRRVCFPLVFAGTGEGRTIRYPRTHRGREMRTVTQFGFIARRALYAGLLMEAAFAPDLTGEWESGVTRASLDRSAFQN
jgi:hypothetical protein